MKKNLIFAVAAVTMLLASCTIQQRVYQPGLYIEWKGIHEAQNKANVDENATESTVVANHEEVAMTNEVVASSNETAIPQVVETPVAVPVEKSTKISKKDLKQAVKEMKQEVSALVANESAVASAETVVSSSQNASQPESWVYILLIFLVPFGCTIAVYLHEGNWTKKVTTNLILTLLCGIPGLIHALITIFGKN